MFWKRKKPEENPSEISTRPVASGIRGVKYIIAIASGKGGVGKSTVTTNLAVALQTAGAKVGLIDADIYGPSQPKMLGTKGNKQPQMSTHGQLVPEESFGIKFVSMGLMVEEGKAVVWRAPMAMKMIQQFLRNVDWGELDYLLIDLPPGTGDVQLTLAQQASLAGAIIVSTPQHVAIGIAKKGLTMFQKVNVPIFGIIENMSGFICEHCGKQTDIFKSGGAAEMAEAMKVPFLGSIPLDPTIMTSGDEGVPVIHKNKDSLAAQAYMKLAQSLQEHIQEVSGASDDEPEELQMLENGDLAISWLHEQGIYKPYDLRVNCACAVCVDENSGKRILNPQNIALDIKITGFRKVGRYAISPSFSDGHSTGIYTFKRLREMMQQQQNEAFSV